MKMLWSKLAQLAPDRSKLATCSACSRPEQAGASRGIPRVVLDCILSSNGGFSTVHGGTLHTGESVAVKFVELNG